MPAFIRSLKLVASKCTPRFIRRFFAASSCSHDKLASVSSIRDDKVKVVVAMSGGVDSSVAAYLLTQMSDKSTNVSGLHMSNWNALDEDADDDITSISNDNRRRTNVDSSHTQTPPKHRRPSNSTFCEASEKEYNDSQAVAQHLSIPLYRVSFASEYWVQVFEPFVESLSTSICDLNDDDLTSNRGEGLTMPNPDFSCNRFIKFGAMKDYAINKLGADFVATGHYAQLWHRGFKCPSMNKQNRTTSSFFEWIDETSTKLERQVLESISGRPEEEWLLRNNLQLSDNSHLPMLISGADRTKDQTYFLSGVKTENFRNVIFPLGHLPKTQKSLLDKSNGVLGSGISTDRSVRDIAHQVKIPTASKKDSMGICFIGKRNFGQFVSQYLPETPTPGSFIDIDTGEIVGHHHGSMHYTIGQGAKISGANIKYFVCGKGSSRDTANTVFVCNDTHHPSLYTDELLVDFEAFNWIGIGENSSNRIKSFNHVPAPLTKGKPIQVLARTRHLQPLVPCTVSWQRHFDGNSSSSLGMLSMRFDKPMRAITPGQIVALYSGNNGLICLGGGPIHSRGSSFMDRGLDVSLSALHPSGHNDLSLLSN